MSESRVTSEQLNPFNRDEVATAWEAFIRQRAVAGSALRGLVLESWQRCRALGIAPQGPCAPRRGDDASLAALQQRHRALLTAAAHTWEVLAHTLMATDIVLVVADPEGVILKVEGNAELVTAAAEYGTGPGRDWSERASGTNAIGTAIVLGQPTVVRSAEHYCAPAKIWDCAAAPIRDQGTGALLGVLDITSMGNMSDSHALALAVTAAHQIEHTLHAMELARSVQLLNWYRAESARWAGRATLLLDERGRVITANEHARGLGVDVSLEFDLDSGQPRMPAQQALRLLEVVPFPRAPADVAGIAGASWQGGVALLAPQPGADPALSSHTPASALHPAFRAVVTRDRALMELIGRAERMARANAPILLHGETGSGKELFAHGIHACSAVAHGPFVAINCGTLSKELAASELLGYESGAFTGAAAKGRRGKFEQADGGTLFLDEIGELSLDVQVHLLRVLQDQVIVRLGGNEERAVRVRIIAATHRDLELEVAQGHFRADLYFRLKVFNLTLPPLRARRADIPLLAQRFLSHLQGIYGLGAKVLADDLLATLRGHDWPGNVRELHGLLETMYILCDRPVLTSADLPEDFARTRDASADPGDGEEAPARPPLGREALLEALAVHGDNMSMLARQLGISRSTLYRKLREFGIARA